MATFELRITTNGLKGATIEKLVAKALNMNRNMVNAHKVKTRLSRAERYSRAESDFDNAKEEILSLIEEIEQWKEGMEGTNLENSSKFSDLEQLLSELEDLENELNNIQFPGVDFPGMY